MRSAPRVRREPAHAREHILDAAERVFQDHLPDAVGLREIAAEAKVSHGLVTHYFGTYDGLVSAVVGRRVERARETAFSALAQATFAPSGDEAPLLTVLVELLADRMLMRLFTWAVLSGRDLSAVIGTGQLARLIDGMAARLTALGMPVRRDRLEFATTAAIAVLVGWAIAGPMFARATGREPLAPEELKREVQRMVRAYLALP
jgi:TetR/AcrR family transcriptional regulator, repressor for neighboring sulfatase